MKILLADDSVSFRSSVRPALTAWGYDVIDASNGRQAWEILRAPNAPDVAILDRGMPEMDGVEVCRRVKAARRADGPYLILLTIRDANDDVASGLEGGADDYLSRPVDFCELRARIRLGVRMVDLQRTLVRQVRELEDALTNVKQLQGLLPICAWCKRIRDRNHDSYWEQIETYVAAHSEARFSHGICPDCMAKVEQEEFSALPHPITQCPPA